MALNNDGLGAIISVAASADTVITGTSVTNNKNRFIRGLLIFNTSTSAAQTCSIHVVPASQGGNGSSSPSNKIARMALAPSDTAFFEFPYPLTLTNTGDCIRVVNDSGSTVNVLPVGDVET